MTATTPGSFSCRTSFPTRRTPNRVGRVRMKGLIPLLAGAVLALSSAAAAGAAQLAKLVGGRIAGSPVSCIDTRYRLFNGGMQVIDGVGVVYDAGETVFV